MDLSASDGTAAALAEAIASLEGGGAIKAAEGAAVTMLLAIGVVAGLVGFFAWTLIRRSRQPDRTLEYLDQLDPGRQPPRARPTPEPTRPPESGSLPWEKPDDWWKK